MTILRNFKENAMPKRVKIYKWGKDRIHGKQLMSLVKIDPRGRITIKGSQDIGDRAIVIPAGTFYVVVPVGPQPKKTAKSWLSTKLSTKELKEKAEELAYQDAIERAKRRGQR